MKYFYFLFAISFLACSPHFNYLGDSYSPTVDEIDVFYDIGDIEKDFRVMGILTADNTFSSKRSSDSMKEKMIEKAKQKGADGILFINIFGAMDGTDKAVVESKLIKYK